MRTSWFLPPLALFALTSAALAQFPPPGAYACTLGDGTAFGTIFLAPDGDYSFTTPDGVQSEGQIASSGTDVRALSGPLFENYHLEGAFETNGVGETRFVFTSDAGDIFCGPA